MAHSVSLPFRGLPDSYSFIHSFSLPIYLCFSVSLSLSTGVCPSQQCFALFNESPQIFNEVRLFLDNCRQLFLTLYPSNSSPQEVFTPAPSRVWSLRQDPPVIRKQNRVPMVSCLVNGCRTWLPSPLLERGCKALGNRKLIICESETPNWKM